MGQTTSNDIVILITLSGHSEALKNILQYTSRNKNIILIGITSTKESTLYKNSNIKLADRGGRMLFVAGAEYVRDEN